LSPQMLGLIDYINYQFPKAGGRVRSRVDPPTVSFPGSSHEGSTRHAPLPSRHASTGRRSGPLQAGPTGQPPSASNLELINSRGGGRWCSSPASASSPLTHPPVRHPPLCPPRESETTYTTPPAPGQAKAKSGTSFCDGEEDWIAGPCRSTRSPTRYARAPDLPALVGATPCGVLAAGRPNSAQFASSCAS
jgi:hypothetical protein